MTFIFKKPKKHPVRKKKSQDSQEVLDRLNRYLSENGGEPAEFIARHWKDQAAVFSYQEIRQAVLDGYIHEETMELWRQDYSKLVSEKMYPVWKDAIAAGSLGQPVIDRQAAGMVFNINEPSVISWLETRGAEFVTNSTETQRKAIQALLMKKIADEHTVDELAKMIRPCIGLTEAQAKANVRFYDNMVATLKEEHPRMSQEAVEKKAREAQLKYAEKQHRYRAHTIAQTEMAIAYNKGADEGIRQAQAQGLLGVMEKRWSTSGDDNVCDVCRALEGTQIAMDDEFDFKGRSLYPGSKRTPPAHPWCGCAVQYIEVEPPKWGAAADDVISQTMQGLSAGNGEEENMEYDPPEFVENAQLDFTNITEDAMIDTRNMANGMRRSFEVPLSDSEKSFILSEIDAIGAVAKVFEFRDFLPTGYSDQRDKIYVSSSIFPSDDGSINPTDLLSVRATLAHEYYGHRAYRGTKLEKGAWNDEFRASYMAARNCPNLTDEDRVALLNDAVYRARKSGITIKNNKFMLEVLYGFK